MLEPFDSNPCGLEAPTVDEEQLRVLRCLRRAAAAPASSEPGAGWGVAGLLGSQVIEDRHRQAATLRRLLSEVAGANDGAFNKLQHQVTESEEQEAGHRIQQSNREVNRSLDGIASVATDLRPLLEQRAQGWAAATQAFGQYQKQAQALDRAVERYYEATFGLVGRGGGNDGGTANDENADPQLGATARQALAATDLFKDEGGGSEQYEAVRAEVARLKHATALGMQHLVAAQAWRAQVEAEAAEYRSCLEALTSSSSSAAAPAVAGHQHQHQQRHRYLKSAASPADQLLLSSEQARLEAERQQLMTHEVPEACARLAACSDHRVLAADYRDKAQRQRTRLDRKHAVLTALRAQAAQLLLLSAAHSAEADAAARCRDVLEYATDQAAALRSQAEAAAEEMPLAVRAASRRPACCSADALQLAARRVGVAAQEARGAAGRAARAAVALERDAVVPLEAAVARLSAVAYPDEAPTRPLPAASAAAPAADHANDSGRMAAPGGNVSGNWRWVAAEGGGGPSVSDPRVDEAAQQLRGANGELADAASNLLSQLAVHQDDLSSDRGAAMARKVLRYFHTNPRKLPSLARAR